ncbi:hypothetical protein MAE02_54310 [Microvirga aerophila]|uniref:Uncharacterized protein n=1 Tax=Microvirga aerophila TaxID=670291 RepID=A0A512C0K9_9HYPH|nr:hypothetical protein MAE02_54310 [Microvirga aerophila]
MRTPERRKAVSIGRPQASLRIDELGLTLAEAKTLLSGLQARITDVQIRDITQHSNPAPAAIDCGN